MDFINELRHTITTWLGGKNTDEWLFVKFRASSVEPLEASEAFSLVNDVVPLLLLKENADAWIEIFETILSLARKSNTTEIPRVLQKELENIKARTMSLGPYEHSKFEELKSYYRIKTAT
jgi:hypothetical protein